MLKTTLAKCPPENLSPVSAHSELSGTGDVLTARIAFDFPRGIRLFHEKTPKRSTLGAWKRSWWDSNEHICRHSGTSAMLKTTLANCPPENLSPVSAHSELSGTGRGLTAPKAFDFPRGTRRFHKKTPKRSTFGALKRRGKRYRAVRIFGRGWRVGTNWHELACFGGGFVGVGQCRNARNSLFCNQLRRVVRRRSDMSAKARSRSSW
jgi:hypothetical protein